MSVSEKLTFKENGGPAFPSSYNSFASGGSGGGGGYSNHGMSLRDYFAAQISAALWSNMEAIDQLAMHPKYEGMTYGQVISKEAYMSADAMLEARK